MLHEALIVLFRNRPRLAPDLLREVFAVELPGYAEARIDSAEFTELQPANYMADLVVLLSGPAPGAAPVTAVVVEVQLRPDPDKRFSWPTYAVTQRQRHRCPCIVLVVAADERTASWAGKPISLGGDSVFQPLVLGPGAVPAVTDPQRAAADPELSVLSAIAHGKRDPERALAIAVTAMGASVDLDPARATLYYDLVVTSLGDAAREALRSMDPAKYEFQSEFARHYFGQGRAEGRAEGEARVVLRMLRTRFGALPPAAEQRVRAAGVEELERWADRLLTASSLDEVFDG